jgi:hypothetical protein
MQGVVGKELRYRMPQSVEEAVQLANTVYHAVKLEKSRNDKIFSVRPEFRRCVVKELGTWQGNVSGIK